MEQLTEGVSDFGDFKAILFGISEGVSFCLVCAFAEFGETPSSVALQR